MCRPIQIRTSRERVPCRKQLLVVGRQSRVTLSIDGCPYIIENKGDKEYNQDYRRTEYTVAAEILKSGGSHN